MPTKFLNAVGSKQGGSKKKKIEEKRPAKKDAGLQKRKPHLFFSHRESRLFPRSSYSLVELSPLFYFLRERINPPLDRLIKSNILAYP
jgi:hypothetical protein